MFVLVLSYFLTGVRTKVKSSLKGELFSYAIFATTAMYFFYYIGVSHASGLNSSMINSCAAFVSVFLAHFFFKNDRLNIQKIIAVAIAFVGLYILNVSGSSGDSSSSSNFTFMGEGFMAISTVMVSLSSIWNKKLLDKYDPFLIAYAQLFYGGLCMIFLSLALGGKINIGPNNLPEFLVCLLWLSLISCTAFSIWSMILKFHPASKMEMYRCTIPIFSAIASYILLGEEIFTYKKILAIGLLVFSLVLLNLKLKNPNDDKLSHKC